MIIIIIMLVSYMDVGVVSTKRLIRQEIIGEFLQNKLLLLLNEKEKHQESEAGVQICEVQYIDHDAQT